MAKRNTYIVHVTGSFKGPDNEYYSSVWGPVTKVSAGIKVGFKNDYIIINPDYIVSQSLCSARPTPNNNNDAYDEDLDFTVKDLYVCVDNLVKDSETINKLNKSKVRKRGI